MKTSLLLVVSILSAQILCAQNVISSTSPSVRDGFTRSGTDIVFTRDGVTQKVEKEIVMTNGMRVRPDGSVMLPNGEKASLGNNQLLTLQGTIETAALTQQGTAPVTTAGSPPTKKNAEIGISATDGVSVSAGAAVVTRNGLTTQLDTELKLPNGIRVQPNGEVTFANGKKMTLRGDQVLAFDGSIVNAPPILNPPPPMQQAIVFHEGRPYLLRGGRAYLIDAALVPNGQMMMPNGALAPMQAGVDFPQGQAPTSPNATGGGALRNNNGAGGGVLPDNVNINLPGSAVSNPALGTLPGTGRTPNTQPGQPNTQPQPGARNPASGNATPAPPNASPAPPKVGAGGTNGGNSETNATRGNAGGTKNGTTGSSTGGNPK